MEVPQMFCVILDFDYVAFVIAVFRPRAEDPLP